MSMQQEIWFPLHFDFELNNARVLGIFSSKFSGLPRARHPSVVSGVYDLRRFGLQGVVMGFGTIGLSLGIDLGLLSPSS